MEMVPVFRAAHRGRPNLRMWLPVSQIQQGWGGQQIQLRSSSRPAVPPSVQTAAVTMDFISQRKQDHGTSPSTAVAQGMIRLQLLAEVVPRGMGLHPWRQWQCPHPTVAMVLVVTTAAKSSHRVKDSQASISLMRMRLPGRYRMKQMHMVPQLGQRTHITGMSLPFCKPSVGVPL